MKIFYDNVSSEYLYPLSKTDVIKLKNTLPSEIISKIRSIRFGCNTKTTQEGRIVEHGNFYDIRMNFCLNNFRSLILSDDKAYIVQIKKFGGVIDFNNRLISWKLPDAKGYALYLLLHEIAHIAFALHYRNAQFSGSSSIAEEKWCNDYALNNLHKIKKAIETQGRPVRRDKPA